MKSFKYNPNLNIRDTIYTTLISKRPHKTLTPTKKEKMEKIERRVKLNGYV